MILSIFQNNGWETFHTAWAKRLQAPLLSNHILPLFLPWLWKWPLRAIDYGTKEKAQSQSGQIFFPEILQHCFSWISLPPERSISLFFYLFIIESVRERIQIQYILTPAYLYQSLMVISVSESQPETFLESYITKMVCAYIFVFQESFIGKWILWKNSKIAFLAKTD